MSLWEVKDVFNKVKNAVLNLTEMEAKVREATSNDPWGASSTLMQEIAQGTYNHQQYNEIMPFLYRSLKEKAPHEWRQIYKCLTLLEYLVKNGSERVISDCRSHLLLIRSLRSFNYIDDHGKDQGVNVNNRAKELISLFMNEKLIREERNKAKNNRNKYLGISSSNSSSIASSSPISSSSNSRYQGFGSDSYPSDSKRVFGRAERSNEEMANSKQLSDAVAAARTTRENEIAKKKQNAKEEQTTKETSAARTASTPSSKTVDLLLDLNTEQVSHSDTTAPTNTEEDMDDWGEFQSGGDAESDDDFTEFQTASTTATTLSENQDVFEPFGSFDGFPAPMSTTAMATNHNGDLFKEAPATNLSDNTDTTPISTGVAPATISATRHGGDSANLPNGSLPQSAQPDNTKKPALDVNDFWSADSPLVALDSLGTQTRKTETNNGPPLAEIALQQQKQQQQSLFGTGVGISTIPTTTSSSTLASGWDSLI